MEDVRVLVVDDQEPFRVAMAAVVEATDGFAVVGAVASGEDSVVAARDLAPDLVLMDVNLPGIDGVEATRQISRLGLGTVVVLLSTRTTRTSSTPSGAGPRPTCPRVRSAPTGWSTSGRPRAASSD